MSEIIVALLTGSFTIFVVGLTLWFENKRNLLEQKRWCVDHFIREKLESLRKLHVALVDCHFTMIFLGIDLLRHWLNLMKKLNQKRKSILGQR